MKLENARYMDEWIRVPLCGTGDKLYHYTTAEGARGIVQDKKFMATKSDFLNDKLEFQYALEVMEKLVQTYLVNETFAERFFTLVKEEIRRLGIISIEDGEDGPSDRMSFYVVAFSKLQNNALLWAEFTEFHGYCLEFSYEKLVEGFEERAFLHGTVIYDEKEQMTCLLEGLLSCIHGLVREGRTDLDGFFEENAEVSEESLQALAEDVHAAGKGRDRGTAEIPFILADVPAVYSGGIRRGRKSPATGKRDAWREKQQRHRHTRHEAFPQSAGAGYSGAAFGYSVEILKKILKNCIYAKRRCCPLLGRRRLFRKQGYFL